MLYHPSYRMVYIKVKSTTFNNNHQLSCKQHGHFHGNNIAKWWMLNPQPTGLTEKSNATAPTWLILFLFEGHLRTGSGERSRCLLLIIGSSCIVCWYGGKHRQKQHPYFVVWTVCCLLLFPFVTNFLAFHCAISSQTPANKSLTNHGLNNQSSISSNDSPGGERNQIRVKFTWRYGSVPPVLVSLSPLENSSFMLAQIAKPSNEDLDGFHSLDPHVSKSFSCRNESASLSSLCALLQGSNYFSCL